MRFSTRWTRLPNWVRHITFITAGIHRRETKYRLMHSEMPMLSGRCSRIAWENVSWCQLTTPERVIEMKKWLPDIGFTLDIKQAMRAGCEPAEFIGAMGSQLVNVHICDWHENGALCLPCEGNFDFDAFMLALKREGYDGPIIVEPYLALIHSDEKLRQSLRKMEAAEQMADKILTAWIDENAKAE